MGLSEAWFWHGGSGRRRRVERTRARYAGLYHFALATIKNRREPHPGLLRARVERAKWGGAAAVQGADGSGGNPLLARRRLCARAIHEWRGL